MQAGGAPLLDRHTMKNSAWFGLTACLYSACIVVLAACGGGGSRGGGAASNDPPTPPGPAASTPDSGSMPIELEFVAMAGETAVSCGRSVPGLGSGRVDAQIKDLRFYIANVALVRGNGSEQALTLSANDEWNLSEGANRVTLIDLEDGSGACAEAGTVATNSLIRGSVPAGDYVGVRMTLGVPPAMNHSDFNAAAAPLDVAEMAWSWQIGRKFAKIEITDPLGAAGTWANNAKTFLLHLGSTRCTGNPRQGAVTCGVPNRGHVQLFSFNPATQRIAVDLQALFAHTDVTRNLGDAQGCMSAATDPDCDAIFQALDLSWQADGTGTGLPKDSGASPGVFRAIAKSF